MPPAGRLDLGACRPTRPRTGNGIAQLRRPPIRRVRVGDRLPDSNRLGGAEEGETLIASEDDRTRRAVPETKLPVFSAERAEGLEVAKRPSFRASPTHPRPHHMMQASRAP